MKQTFDQIQEIAAKEFGDVWYHANRNAIPFLHAANIRTDSEEEKRAVAIAIYKVLQTAKIDWNAGVTTAEEALAAVKGRQWIPCSERLPEKDGRTLVWDVSDKITIQHFSVTYGTWSGFASEVAWMPLPEPYVPQSPPEATDKENK